MLEELRHLLSRKYGLILLLVLLLLALFKDLIVHGHVCVNLVEEVWVKLELQLIISFVLIFASKLYLRHGGRFSRLILIVLLLLLKLLHILLLICVNDVARSELLLILVSKTVLHKLVVNELLLRHPLILSMVLGKQWTR